MKARRIGAVLADLCAGAALAPPAGSDQRKALM
jgi:hypothetical protein